MICRSVVIVSGILILSQYLTVCLSNLDKRKRNEGDVDSKNSCLLISSFFLKIKEKRVSNSGTKMEYIYVYTCGCVFLFVCIRRWNGCTTKQSIPKHFSPKIEKNDKKFYSKITRLPFEMN